MQYVSSSFLIFNALECNYRATYLYQILFDTFHVRQVQHEGLYQFRNKKSTDEYSFQRGIYFLWSLFPNLFRAEDINRYSLTFYLV